MYPEGWLIDPAGKNLLFFEKDPMNPIHEGYIGYWLMTEVNFKQFRYRKRTSKIKAIEQWTHLLELGWRMVDEKEQAA